MFPDKFMAYLSTKSVQVIKKAKYAMYHIEEKQGAVGTIVNCTADWMAHASNKGGSCHSASTYCCQVEIQVSRVDEKLNLCYFSFIENTT